MIEQNIMNIKEITATAYGLYRYGPLMEGHNHNNCHSHDSIVIDI